MKFQGSVGQGTGVQKFSIKPGGVGLSLAGAAETPLQAAAAPEVPALPSVTPEPAAPVTPFAKLYPGIDPSKVEMRLDDKGRIRAVPIQAPAAAAPEVPAAPIAPVPIPPAPAAPAQSSDLAELKAMMTAVMTAQLTGRPLAEILSGQPAAPAEADYSRYDLTDDDERTEFVKQLRADTRAEMRAEFQSQMAGHLPAIQGSQRHGEYFAVQAAHGSEPDFQEKAALANELIGNNPNVSFKATFDLVSRIRGSVKPSEPTRQDGPNLTPAQQEAKAAQAARYQSNGGGRANGAPVVPAGVRTFKQHAAWAAHQLALGYSPEEIAAAGRR